MVGYSSNCHSRPMLETFPVKLMHFMQLRCTQLLFNHSNKNYEM